MSGDDLTPRDGIEQVPALGFLPERDGVTARGGMVINRTTEPLTVSPAALAGLSKRYAADQDLDDKSGYRLACRPVAMLEGHLLKIVNACGSITFATAMAQCQRIGAPEREISLALLRLVVRGDLAYDLATTVLSKPVKPRPWYVRWFAWGRVHPSCWLIAAISITAPCCALWAYLRSLA